MKDYYQIIKEKNLTDFSYQRNFLTNPDFFKPNKPIVLAFGTGGGKTFTTIMKLDMYYSDKSNKKSKTIIFPHATNVLKDNFTDSLEKYGNKSFDYFVVEKGSQLTKAFKSNKEVIIILPQVAIRHLSKLKQVEWMIVDEAHEWYGRSTYNKLIRHLKPKHQLLLTGTPSKFNNQFEKFLYYHVSVDELRKAGKAGNARIEIVSSNYNLKSDDITSSLNVKSSVTNSKNITSLKDVLNQMLKTLNNPTGLRQSSINTVFGTVFNTLKKTVIFCNSQKQANDFYKELNRELPNQVLKSLSKDGGNSEEFEVFKKDDNIKVLVLVRKGRLGFDMSKLYNIVDFSLTTNVDVISQMLGRILRPDGNQLKYYFKVAPQNTVWFYQSIMMVVLRLTMQDAYEIYDGNQNKVRIPNPLPPRNKERRPRGEGGNSEPTFREITTDLILDLDFFRQVLHKGNKAFQTISWCTLDNVRKECFELRDRNNEGHTYNECLNAAKKWTKKGDFQKYDVKYYERANKMGWIDKITKEANLSSRLLKMTKEIAYERAKPYLGQLAIKFKQGDQPAYSWAVKNKDKNGNRWIDVWFPKKGKTGPKKGNSHPGRKGYKNNFKLKK